MKHQEVGFGFYSNPHFIVYSLDPVTTGFSFKDNTIICAADNGVPFGLLKFREVRYLTISGNTVNGGNIATGPINLLEAETLRGLSFTGNNLNFGRNNTGLGTMIKADASWGAVISNNVLGNQNEAQNGIILGMNDQWKGTIFSGNYVAGCSRVASAASQPVNFVYTNNIVNFDFGAVFDGVTPTEHANNIQIN